MLRVLGEKVSVFVVCKPEGERGEDPELLLEEAQKYATVYPAKDVKDAVEEAKETLIRHGLDRELAERFFGEILEGQT